MFKISITDDKIKRLNELTEAIEDKKDVLSEMIRTAQDRHSNRQHKAIRNNQEVSLAEKVLWTELKYGDKNSEAYKIMRKQYPEMFELQDELDKLSEGLKNFSGTEFGFFFSEMTLSRLVALIIGVVKYVNKTDDKKKRFFNYFGRR